MRDILGTRQLDRQLEALRRRPTRTTREALLLILESDHPRSRIGGWTVRELWTALIPPDAPWAGISIERVRQVLHELEAERLVWRIRRQRPARWRVTP